MKALMLEDCIRKAPQKIKFFRKILSHDGVRSGLAPALRVPNPAKLRQYAASCEWRHQLTSTETPVFDGVFNNFGQMMTVRIH
jgi:hypothetical protein